MNKIVWIVVAIVVIALIVVAGGNKGADIEGPVRIGFIGPLTGDAAVYGEPSLRITQIAVAEINANGGIGGYPIELIAEDGKCNGRDAASAMQKLANVDKVEVVIGGFCSGESLAAVPIAEQAGVFLFSPGSSNPGLTDISPLFARNYPSDAAQGTVLANMAGDKGLKKIAVIQEQTDYAAGLYGAFDKRFTERGGTTVKEEFVTGASDFRSSLTKLRAANPDGLFVVVQTPASASRIFRQMGELGWKTTLFVSDVVPGDPSVVAENKDFLEGALAAEFGTNPNNAKFRHMVEAYEAEYGEEPPFQAYAQTEYDAVYILAEGISAVGYDGELLGQWVRSKVKNWSGASGSVTIGPDGDPVAGHIPKVIMGGKVELYN